MKKVIIVGLASCLFFAHASAFAIEKTATAAEMVAEAKIPTEVEMEEIIVSANKIGTVSDNITTGVDLISGEDIDAQHNHLLSDSLKTLSGVTISARSYIGQAQSIRIRGHRAQDTQMRYNDFPLRDPLGFSSDSFSSFYSNLLFPKGGLERIEVLKGSQGTLYGSSAMGGVVSLFSPKGWNTGANASFSLETGSYHSTYGSASLSYGSDKNYINFTPLAYSTAGFLDLDYKNTGFTLGAGSYLTEYTTLELDVLMNQFESSPHDSPTHMGNGVIRPQRPTDGSETGEFILAGITLKHEFNDIWNARLKTSYSHNNREYSGGWADNRFLGNIMYSEVLNTIKPLENLTFLFGADYERQSSNFSQSSVPSYNIDESFASYAFFAKALLTFFDERLLLSTGGRYNLHTEFSSHFTWDAGAAYAFDFGTRFYTNVATGYRVPGIYELYASFNPAGANVMGSLDLEPEESTSFEIGVEQKLFNDRIEIGAAYFMTDYDNFLKFEMGPHGTIDGSYTNFGEGELRGFEIYINTQLHEKVRLNVAFTHAKLETTLINGGKLEEDKSVPQNTLAASLYVYPIEPLTLVMTGRWESQRDTTAWGDFSVFPSPPNLEFEEDSFFTLDLAATYDVNDHLSIYGKIDNLLDEEYTIHTYKMPGTNFNVGFQYKF